MEETSLVDSPLESDLADLTDPNIEDYSTSNVAEPPTEVHETSNAESLLNNAGFGEALDEEGEDNVSQEAKIHESGKSHAAHADPESTLPDEGVKEANVGYAQNGLSNGLTADNGSGKNGKSEVKVKQIQKGAGSSLHGGKSSIKCSTLVKKTHASGNSGTSSSSSKPFLRSSSSSALARRQDTSAPQSSNNNGSPNVASKPSVLKKHSATSTSGTVVSSPATPGRRSSISGLSTPSRPTTPATQSRRASLSALSTRSAPSITELNKWATSPSSKSNPPLKSAVSKRPTSLSLQSNSDGGKTIPDFLKRSSPSSIRSPIPSAGKSPVPSKISPKALSSSPKAYTNSKSLASNGGLSGSANAQKKPSTTDSFTNKRSSRSSEGAGLTSRSSNERTPASTDRAPSMLSRRKSLTPESRDTRFIPLPPVDVKAGDDVRLDLRGQKVRSLDCNLVNLTPKLEFVYLRDNKLSSMNGIEILKRVKVLDLSFNEFKGAGFEPLTTCKALQQLYLAGNQITSLSGLPQLPNLEFLSVAQNKLKSLAMAAQPRLQVLAASKNKISTLKGFPHLPALEHLRLEENPILDVPHIEAGAILLVGPTLKKFNDRDLSTEEVKLSQSYPAWTAFCVQEGLEFCSPEEALESTKKFMFSKWKDQLPPGYLVTEAYVDRPSEEDPCRCRFKIQKESKISEAVDLDLHYQWHIGDRTPTNFVPIEGSTSEVYWPKHEDVGYHLKVECTPFLQDVEFPPIFAISLPVAAGTGCPRVLGIILEGEPVEGNIISGSAKVAWCGGTPGTGIVSWLRKSENSSAAIIGAEDYGYSLTLEDVGANLVFMYTPVSSEGIKGEPQYAMTSTVQAAAPCVSDVRILGDAVEGNVIRGTGRYFGGKEGSSTYEWLGEDPDTGEFKYRSRGSSEYLLTDEDVGLRLMFIYTPFNSEGICGDPISAVTARVLRAPPRVNQLRIVGDIREGNKVVVSGQFVGGVEGASRVQWFKTISPHVMSDSDLDAISTSKIAKAFRIPLGAIGHYLVAKYTPVRSDGESGEAAFVISDSPVEMLPPSLNFLSITGDFLEGETLTASYGYIGGHEGGSHYDWYIHENEYDPGSTLPEARQQLQHFVTKEAVHKLISFRCTPVRDDGTVGETRSTMSQERIRAGPPKLLRLKILGDAIEGSMLQVDKEYCGGEEGYSKLQWFLVYLLLTSPDGAQREIKGANDHTYAICTEDIDGFLCCSCLPVRNDGVKGDIAVSPLLGPVLPGPPMCESLEICGPLVESGRISFKASYKGGEKGLCRHEWRRKVLGGRDVFLSNNEILELTPEEVGSRIELVFTPVRKDGFTGISKKVVSDIVVDAEPEGKSLFIPNCFEDMELVPQTLYFGGREGESKYTWYRISHKIDEPQIPDEAEPVGSSMVFTPKLEDVGTYLSLKWVPVRKDGKHGKPLIACSRSPVAPAPPSVREVTIKEVSSGMFVGDGEYYGGFEGDSKLCWYRETADGSSFQIEGATSKTYVACEDDYTCRVVFGYTPVRIDGAVGQLIFSEPSSVIYPELPRVQKLILSGKAIEGEVLTALEVIPKGDSQQRVWEKYKKDVKYAWSRSTEPGGTDSFEAIPLQRSCSYRVRLEDVGYCMRCECIVSDVFGRSADPVSILTAPVAPGLPRVDKLEVEGRGYHTNLYAVRGIYSGGKEGKSLIQWFRAMAGSPDLIPLPGEVGRMYEANVDDVGYRLIAVYTPIREDGIAGNPTSTSTELIEVEPEVAKEVKQKLETGAVKFEALRDRDRSPVKSQQHGFGSLERRILDVNRKRVKVVKPGSKTSFPSTEIRGAYTPPFHVELFRNDQHRIKIVIDSETEVDLMVQSRHIRDVIALVIRGFSQKFNSTPLNLLLKM
ncbi:hypothetical protein O6H91_15G086300 [Diphasiastrum complanatum]|uniref:Uncharacterized protein n=1 Tax=Diphasiastrum complanatum TaxID=34168 RepID=A0ACC2BKD5_DIPCM|nr:hypothetical protein O6H91_15G086300 [Diphasiastrum complanatum]